MKRNCIQQFLIWAICLTLGCLLFACSSEESDIQRGHRYIDRKDYAKAIQNYSFALKENPSNPDIYFYRGFARMKAGELVAAIDDFSMAIRLNPNYFEAYIDRGSIFKQINKIDEAISDYDKAIELKPNEPQALLARADMLFSKHLYDKAISDYDTVIKINPKASIAYRGRGDAYYQKNDYQNSIIDYQSTIDLNPKDSFAFNNLAWIFSTCFDETLRDAEKALQYSKKAVSLDPSAHNLSTLAAAYAENNNFNEAINILKKLIDERQDNDEVKVKLKRYLTSFKNHKPLRVKAGQ